MTQTTITYRNKTITLDSAAVKGCTSYQYADGVDCFDIEDDTAAQDEFDECQFNGVHTVFTIHDGDDIPF